MITKSDLEAVLAEMNAEDRARLGEPPTAEEMLAYRNGELSAEEEARVRALLVCYPELARALVTPFEPEHRVLQFRHAWTALAAALALLFGALFWHAESNARRLANELSTPRVSDFELLMPDGQRGPGEASATLTAQGESFLLGVPLINEPNFDTYRLEIADTAATAPRTLWSSGPLHRGANDTFAILVPRAFLPPGKYAVVLHGVSGARDERLTSYAFRVPGR